MLASYQELARAVEADAIDIAGVLLDQWFSPDFLAHNRETVDLVRRWFDELGKDGILATVRVAEKITDLRSALPQLSLPVYLRVGACDLATPEAWSREIADLLPNARLEVVEGVGHFPHFEDHDNTLAAMLFIDIDWSSRWLVKSPECETSNLCKARPLHYPLGQNSWRLS